jgi:hypothetical protein
MGSLQQSGKKSDFLASIAARWQGLLLSRARSKGLQAWRVSQRVFVFGVWQFIIKGCLAPPYETSIEGVAGADYLKDFYDFVGCHP